MRTLVPAEILLIPTWKLPKKRSLRKDEDEDADVHHYYTSILMRKAPTHHLHHHYFPHLSSLHPSLLQDITTASSFVRALTQTITYSVRFGVILSSSALATYSLVSYRCSARRSS
eukprot:scaffold7522_cov202-Skeletonema_marinoi.AAC.30